MGWSGKHSSPLPRDKFYKQNALELCSNQPNEYWWFGCLAVSLDLVPNQLFRLYNVIEKSKDISQFQNRSGCCPKR